MGKISIDREMRRARQCERNGAIDDARGIYASILEAFPNNLRARKALSALDEPDQQNTDDPPQDTVSALLSIYHAGEFTTVADRASELLDVYPSSPALWNLAGAANKALGRIDKAELAFRMVLDIEPEQAQAHFNLGTLLSQQYKFDDAAASFQTAIGIKPDYALAYNSLGHALKNKGELPEAIESFAQALRLAPDYPQALAQKLHQQANICDWRAFGEFARAHDTLGITDKAIDPFTMLAFEDNPEHQLARARLFAQQNLARRPSPLPVRPRSGKIRLGYFSADFHDHATLYLMSGLFREHDKSRFDVLAFSYGPDSDGEYRELLKQRVDQFINIRGMPNNSVVDLARNHGLDIAIDLKGYTTLSRSGFFGHRLAPVQINYLGYPGTMGADFIDYIIADPVTIPHQERQFYSEKIIYLPNSYQPNDDQREIAPTRSARSEFSLPEDGFVFCSFNNSYKISPREFEIWMRLLGKVEGSVLWLLRSNRWAEENLQKEAETRGVDPGRIVFASKLPHAEHLARLKHADLFVDTFNYNAHTTGSDALWAGLPIVTRAGRQFAARVGASLLTAVGLPELITETDEAYEALILDLATHPDKLAAIRAKLAENRQTHPLFDTVRYARDFENALETVFEQHMQAAP